MEDMIEIKSDNIDDNIDDGVFDVTSQFKEKNWGKDENGLKVVDGYSFRGKQTFLKVVEGFKNIMKKTILMVSCSKLWIPENKEMGLKLTLK